MFEHAFVVVSTEKCRETIRIIIRQKIGLIACQEAIQMTVRHFVYASIGISIVFQEIIQMTDHHFVSSICGHD